MPEVMHLEFGWCPASLVKAVYSMPSSGVPQGRCAAAASKSVHMRMVHAVSRGEGISPAHTLHRRGDRGVVLEVRQLVAPRAIHIERLDHIGHQVLQAVARVMAGAEVMHVAKGARD